MPATVQFSAPVLTPTVYEGNLVAVSTVTLTGGAGIVNVHYATSDLTAVAGTDYAARSGILKFLPGQTSESIDVTILGGVGDSDNTYLLTLSAPTGASLGSPPTQAVTFFVTNPVSLTSPGDQSNYDGDPVDLGISASDALGNAPTYSATNLPTGLSIDSSTGVISGTIASNADAAGPYSVTVTATDGTAGVSASQTYNWAITQPTITLTSPGDQSNYDGDAVSLSVAASEDASHALTWSAAGLPSGLSIDANGNITGTIASNADQGGPYSVTVSATDGAAGVSASQTFSWAVSAVAVTLANPGDQSNYDGDFVSLALYATDNAGHQLAFTVAGLPTGLYVTNCGNIEGVIDPAADSDSPYSATITATDSAADVSESVSFDWVVSPVSVSFAQPSNQGNYDGDAASLQLSASDSAGHSLTYTVDDATPLPSGLYLDPFSGEISGTIAAGADAASPYAISVTAADLAANVSATQTFDWTVGAVSISLTSPGSQSNYDGDAVTLDLSGTDSAGHSLWYSVDAAAPLPSGLTLDHRTGVISGTISPGDNASSPYTVTVTATDRAAGASASQTFTWADSAVSVSLTSPGAQTNDDGDAVALQLAATDSAGHSLTYSVDPSAPLPAGLTLDPGSGRIYGIVGSEDDASSPYSVTLIATDAGAGVSASQTVAWTVNSSSGGAYETVTTLENQPVTLTAADFGITCGDGTTAVEISTLPTGGTLADNGAPVTADQFVSRADIASGDLTYTPAHDAFGTAYDSLDFALVHGGCVGGDPEVVFNVTWVNQAPSFTASNPQSTDEAVAVSVPNWASFNPGAPNQAWETPTYAISDISNPALFSVLPSVSPDGTLSYTVKPWVSGSSVFCVAVANNGGTANGGQDASAPIEFTALVLPRISYVVNTVDDTNDANVQNNQPLDGRAIDVNGMTSLRAAIQEGNGAPAGTTVRITFNLPANSVIYLGTALPNLTGDLRISGSQGLVVQRLQGAGQFRIFAVSSGADVLIRGVTISGGQAVGQLNPTNGSGGGILNQGNLELFDDSFSYNSANWFGGAVSNESGALLVAYGCYFYFNGAPAGGAISNFGDARIGGGTEVFVNSASLWGGGIYNAFGGFLTVRQSSIYANTAALGGGGLYNAGTAYISNATVYANAANNGGGVFNFWGTTVLDLTSVYQNNASGANGKGGGLYISRGSLVEATSCNIVGNTSGAALFDGGAFEPGARWVTINCNLSGNFRAIP